MSRNIKMGWNISALVKVLKHQTVLTDCQVHGVAFSQRSQSVQTATLVVILQKLNKTCRQTIIICNSSSVTVSVLLTEHTYLYSE